MLGAKLGEGLLSRLDQLVASRQRTGLLLCQPPSHLRARLLVGFIGQQFQTATEGVISVRRGPSGGQHLPQDTQRNPFIARHAHLAGQAERFRNGGVGGAWFALGQQQLRPQAVEFRPLVGGAGSGDQGGRFVEQLSGLGQPPLTQPQIG